MWKTNPGREHKTKVQLVHAALNHKQTCLCSCLHLIKIWKLKMNFVAECSQHAIAWLHWAVFGCDCSFPSPEEKQEGLRPLSCERTLTVRRCRHALLPTKTAEDEDGACRLWSAAESHADLKVGPMAQHQHPAAVAPEPQQVLLCWTHISHLEICLCICVCVCVPILLSSQGSKGGP